jgi:hypothetical protein
MDKTIFKNFSIWLNNILENNDFSDVIAFNFNLYEGEDSFQVQLIGTDSFDENDDDWACDEVFTSENLFIIQRSITGQKWDEGLAYIKKIVEEYLKSSSSSKVLKEKDAVAIGFVDGDLEVLLKNG